MSPEQFILLIAPSAQRFQQKHGIFASVTIAQAALETGWGKFLPVDKYTGKESYNLYGIKGEGPAGFVVCDTQEYRSGKMVTEEAKFRAYHSWEESIEGHSYLLLLERYRPVREAASWRMAVMYLQSSGYATDPFYANKLTRIIEENQLYKYDELPVPFPDIPVGHWAVGAVTRLKEAGIIKGEDGLFHGDRPATRYEVAVMLDALFRKLTE